MSDSYADINYNMVKVDRWLKWLKVVNKWYAET